MTKQPQISAYDRRAIMRDAHKRFRDGRRLGIDWTFARCLWTAWQAARMRHERDMTGETMRRIAGIIEADLSRRITLVPEIRKGMNDETHPMGFRLSRSDHRRQLADERGAIR